MIFKTAFTVIVSLAIGVFIGLLWSKHNLLHYGPLVLTEPLELLAEDNHTGTLPKGTILYSYTSGPSSETFVVFVNTKRLDVLERHIFEHNYTVAPIDAF